jgi:hypothetical protein
MALLPEHLEWNIMKFMSHPCADLIKQAVEDVETFDDHFGGEGSFSFKYLQHYWLENTCDACAKPYRNCKCWCHNCARPCPECKYECYDWDDDKLYKHRRMMDRRDKYQYLQYE